LAEFLIPFSNAPQEFSISIDSREITIFQRWNEFSNCWVIDISDTLTSASLIAGLPLVTGADLFEPFPELGLSGSLLVYTDGNSSAVPTLDNLGQDANVYYLTV
jgi:hypothetical protein